MSKLFKYTWIAQPCRKHSESYLYNPGKCSTEWCYVSICVASSLLYPSIRMIKIISGMKIQTKNWGQDVLRTEVLIVSSSCRSLQTVPSEKSSTESSASRLPGEITWEGPEEFVQTSGTSEQNWPQPCQWIQKATENYSFHPSTQL